MRILGAFRWLEGDEWWETLNCERGVSSIWTMLGPENDTISLSANVIRVENFQILKLRADGLKWSLASSSGKGLSSETPLRLILILSVVTTWRTVFKIQVLSCSLSFEHGAKEKLIWDVRNCHLSRAHKLEFQLNYHWMSLQLFQNLANMTKTDLAFKQWND